jgi:predicted transporter
MEPIISPWLIYFASLSEGVAVFLGLSAVVVGICAIPAYVFGTFEDKDVSDGDKIRLKTLSNWLIFVFICTVTTALLLPTKETIYQMIAASMVTPDNLITAADGIVTVKNAVKNDILEVIRVIANTAGQ